MTDIQPGTILRQRYRVIRELGAGGQGQTFEVEDAGQRKVLKVLMRPSSQTIKYFQKEAEILSRLDHPGIPGVDAEDGYFVEAMPGQTEPLHCLVMAKIEGINLYEWRKKSGNGVITEGRALDWLTQLVTILHEIHQNDFFHRDIKPGNIMLQPDGTLAIVDFGISKEVTDTYLAKIATSADITSCGTDFYTAPEVFNGKAIPQSDFFSLGRTFVFLLTGQPLGSLPRNPQNDLVWRDCAPHVSSTFAALLDWLMQKKSAQRPPHTQYLLDYIAVNFTIPPATSGTRSKAVLESQPSDLNATTQPWEPALQPQRKLDQSGNTPQVEVARSPTWFHLPTRREFSMALLLSVGCAIVTVGIRYTGLLQTWELQTFDQMMRLRQEKAPNEDLLIVGLTYEDIKTYSPQRDISIDESTLEKLLDKLEQAKPAVIGLDLYRDVPHKNMRLKQRLQKSEILYGICKVGDELDPDGVAKPNDIPEFGFADVLSEPDNLRSIRRHLLKLQASPKSCNAENAFSVRVALDFLHTRGVDFDLKKDFWRLGKTKFQFLEPHTGFYQTVDTQGYQILLNPRASKGKIDQVNLRDLLEGKINTNVIQNRIVLIGVTSPSSNRDTWFIPGVSDAIVPGVMLQAEMVSQLVSAALDARPILRFWALWQDALLIVGWAVVGGTIVLVNRGQLSLGLATGVALGTLVGVSLIFLNEGILVPVVPSVLALVSASGSSFLYCSNRVKANRVKTVYSSDA